MNLHRSWVRVEAELPDDSREVQVTTRGRQKVRQATYIAKEKQWYSTGHYLLSDVIGWQDLPEPMPEKAEDDCGV